jgi:hypothetical protein
MTESLAPMTARHQRPAWVRRLNVMADAVGGGARALVPIDGEALLEAAEASLGGRPSGDFGDPEWQARFLRLAAAVDASDMHLVGRLLTKEELLRSLRARLLLMRTVEEQPAIAEERVEAPVIVTGPARSGTTILFELLSLDSGLRAPSAWEALHPVPATAADTPERRLAWSECEQEIWADVQPEFAAVHELRSDLPVECVTLTAPSFAGTHWPMIAQLEGWAPDLALNYDFHRRILQVLQHGAEPAPWLLKTPGHLMTLEMLFASYPDAWIVQTHRDPAKTMPSTVSTTALVQWMRRDAVDVPLLAATIEATFAFALNHTVELRKSGAVPDRFVDVHFQELLAEPVATLRAAYGTMGRPFDASHAERIEAYLRNKPKGKFGTHHYAPEDWGFTADGLREKLGPYIAHFGVALES